MTALPGSTGAQPVSLTGTLPRSPLAWIYAVTLLCISFSSFTHAFGPLMVVSVFFVGAVAYCRAWELAPSALMLFFLYPASRLYPDWIWRLPAVTFLAPLVLCGVSCLATPSLRRGFRAFRRGRLDQIVWLLIVLTSLVSALALILWALWTDYLGVATQMMAPLKQTPRWFSLLIVVPAFALVNAAAEEGVYRGVLQEGLEESWGAVPGAVIALQASAFAAAHYQAGFPNGKVGYLMVFVYALMLGWLRRRSNGILAPYIAHVAADAVIGVTLVLLAG